VGGRDQGPGKVWRLVWMQRAGPRAPELLGAPAHPHRSAAWLDVSRSAVPVLFIRYCRPPLRNDSVRRMDRS
jgi:hypothetical protein